MTQKYLCFEDVDVGAELPSLVKGPLTSVHLMRWSAAIENWHKIHYDRDFAIQHDGLPNLLVNGSLKQQFIVQLLQDWVGTSGWVWRVRFQFRAMNIVGDELSIWGRVKSKKSSSLFGLVDLDLGIKNGHGKESTPGEATVALPYRGGQPVPYPFPEKLT